MADMSSTGTITWRSSGLRAPASTIVTSRPGPVPARKRPIASSGRCVADRPIRCMGGASAGAEAFEPFEAQREVGAALGAGDRVDLVDDDVLDAAEDLADLAGQHQVQRFGGRDEDVRRVAGDLAAVLGRGVAGAAGDADGRHRLAESLRRVADAGQRRPQVPLDVVGQRLERRDVEDADGAGRAALDARRRRMRGEPVQGPEERGERLAAPGRGVDQRVLAGGDRRPAAGLGVGRRLEARLEPLADGARERGEGVGGIGAGLGPRLGRGHGTASIGRWRHFEQMVESAAGPCARRRRSDPLLAVSQ